MVFKLYFFIIFFFLISSIMGDDRCQTRCGYKEINFPFQLKNQPNECRCGYPVFDVSCNKQTDTIIAFPSSGNFTAQIIGNVEQIIEIGDPNGCLAKRLLEGFDLSGTPFQTVYLRNFTLLNCSNDVPFWYPEFVTYISCLSSENNYTVAISVDRPDLFVPFSSCLEIATVSVSSLLKWEYLTDTMWLTWNEPDCKRCLKSGGVCKYNKNTGFDVGYSVDLDPGSSNLAKYFAIFLAVSVFFIVGLVICISRVKCCLHKWRNTNTETFTYGSTILQSNAVKKGLDQRVIEMYPTMVFGGSRELPNPNDSICSICLVEYQAKDTLKTTPSEFFLESLNGLFKFLLGTPVIVIVVCIVYYNVRVHCYDHGHHPNLPRPNDNTCSIRLSEYQAKETIRTIPYCSHYFHANCIDEWLKLNAACPVCHNTPDYDSAHLLTYSTLSSSPRPPL
ncbi:hypothetical protein CXB51_008039 [Gossypium anomalum]|uniref:RING-type E3 ubiquitin transferase n=1 Tax=Gossypium anomalum TaxID=47600 RepID=A0A8J5ZIX0_9ROSI|nr:hypothetical protein CXB51_008039 [Gossypium anomalum]